MSNCGICYTVIQVSDEIIACEFCRNEFHVNHLGHWVTIQQRCPICKEILSPQFIEHLDNISSEVEFDQELMEAFRMDLEIEEMQNRKQEVASGKPVNQRTLGTNVPFGANIATMQSEHRFCPECGNPMAKLYFQQNPNRNKYAPAINYASKHLVYCPEHKIVL